VAAGQNVLEPPVAKRGRPPNPPHESPDDAFASTKVRRKFLSMAKKVAEHRGVDLWEYLESILASSIHRDHYQMGVEIAKQGRRGDAS